MTSPAAAFAGLLNSGKGLAVGVGGPLLPGTAEEEEEDDDEDDDDEEQIASRP